MKNKTLSILRFIKHLILIIAAGMLSSCAVPDPMFSANSRNIQNTDFPKNKIVGTWVHVHIDSLQTEQAQFENKVYFELHNNGRGNTQEVRINKVNGDKLVIAAPLTWNYLGNNWWKIILPASTAYKVVESRHLFLNPGSYQGSSEHRVRYFNGNLYDIEAQRVLVPANETSVSQLANRMRRATPTIYMNSGSR